MWADKAIQESRRLTEAQKRRYKDCEEIPGSRYELELWKYENQIKRRFRVCEGKTSSYDPKIA